MPGRNLGDRAWIGDITLSTGHGGNGVPTFAGLSGDGLPCSACGAENGNLLHAADVNVGASYLWVTGYGGGMLAPLRADMFDPVCPSDLSPLRIGDKWGGMIIRCLEDGPRRFSELRVPLRGITSKVLTQSLRSLEHRGLISRADNCYVLTALGRSTIEPMDTMCAWSRAHWDELIDAREKILK